MGKVPVSDLKPEHLIEWRLKQPGKFKARNGQIKRGWTQEQAAAWYGVSHRQWQRYENGKTPVPLHLVRRIAAHRMSFDDVLDRVLDLDQELVDKWGSPFEQLAHDRVTTIRIPSEADILGEDPYDADE